jgi:hypothetical protein
MTGSREMLEPFEIFFEITLIGPVAKVAAIDGASGTEVCVFGPAHAAENELKRLAVTKLRARLARCPDGST